MIADLIARAVAGNDLEAAEMQRAMEAIFGGALSPAQTAGFLVALRMKGESPSELAVAARVMRQHAVPVHPRSGAPLLDTCGTGGDGSNNFNISTAAALVIAAAGVRVAKHGNRAATSKTGSADVLEALGVDLGLSPERIARCIDEVGIAFVFARAHHPAMKHVAPVRAELGVRTLFNLLGPLTNPAGATHQLLGVADGSKLNTMVEVLLLLGTEAAWVVHGAGDVDEISLAGPTQVAALHGGAVTRFELVPEDFGLERASPEALAASDAAQSAAIVRAVIAGERGAPRDAVVINAAAALCVAGAAPSPREGARLAQQAIDSGAAQRKLDAWVGFTR